MDKYIIIRFVSLFEIKLIKNNGFLNRSYNICRPYHKDEVVFVFLTSDINKTILKHGSTLADLRELKINDKLFILLIDLPIISLEINQSGWNNGSNVYKDDIPVCKIKIIGHSIIIGPPCNSNRLAMPIFYDLPMSPELFINCNL